MQPGQTHLDMLHRRVGGKQWHTNDRGGDHGGECGPVGQAWQRSGLLQDWRPASLVRFSARAARAGNVGISCRVARNGCVPLLHKRRASLLSTAKKADCVLTWA